MIRIYKGPPFPHNFHLSDRHPDFTFSFTLFSYLYKLSSFLYLYPSNLHRFPILLTLYNFPSINPQPPSLVTHPRPVPSLSRPRLKLDPYGIQHALRLQEDVGPPAMPSLLPIRHRCPGFAPGRTAFPGVRYSAISHRSQGKSAEYE